jgi:hypothetical protein
VISELRRKVAGEGDIGVQRLRRAVGMTLGFNLGLDGV